MENMMTVKGAYRLQIEEDGEIVGDSDWQENLDTTGGFLNITKLIGTSLTGSEFSHANVGTGGAPATNATALPGEVTGTSGAVQRAAVTAATSSTSQTLRFTATLASAASFVTQTENISNVGLFAHSTTVSLMAGNTFASSSVATNQAVNLTYDLIFATA